MVHVDGSMKNGEGKMHITVPIPPGKFCSKDRRTLMTCVGLKNEFRAHRESGTHRDIPSSHSMYYASPAESWCQKWYHSLGQAIENVGNDAQYKDFKCCEASGSELLVDGGGRGERMMGHPAGDAVGVKSEFEGFGNFSAYLLRAVI
ncbi:hypothetical protein C8R43DRAFT_1100848 [Mycena crocata]|nr:hypothetical protein C8R43DRAFT_1100848 [Mycena crocata]